MSLSVLIIDNEDATRKLIQRALKKKGLKLSHVFEAENGKEGLKIMSEQNVDFALIDVHMPVMDGEELASKIKEREDLKRIPLIFISGESRPEWIERLEQKSLGFIQKPFTADILAETVINLLSK